MCWGLKGPEKWLLSSRAWMTTLSECRYVHERWVQLLTHCYIWLWYAATKASLIHNIGLLEKCFKIQKSIYTCNSLQFTAVVNISGSKTPKSFITFHMNHNYRGRLSINIINIDWSLHNTVNAEHFYNGTWFVQWGKHYLIPCWFCMFAHWQINDQSIILMVVLNFNLSSERQNNKK